MTARERVRRCIHFQDVDVIPWQIDCTSEAAARILSRAKLIRSGGENAFGDAATSKMLHDYLGSHLWYIRSEPVHGCEQVQSGMWRDEWNVVWDRRIDRDIGNPVNCVLEKRRLSGLKIPDPSNPERFSHFRPLIEMSDGRYIIVKISRCLFERAWSLRGMENLFIDFVENPDFVHELLDILADFAVDQVRALSPFPVDGIRFSDDWGGQRGLLMSPEMWREFLKPRLKRMYAQAHEQGYDVFIHSCGDISRILDDLTDIGVDVFNPLQPEVMDVEETIHRFSHRLSFNGGVSIQRTLPFESPDGVRREVEHRLELARRYGGFIPAPSHDMPYDVPFENIVSMVDTFKSQSGKRIDTE
jgi:uroporphyrinogen decarboxylase